MSMVVLFHYFAYNPELIDLKKKETLIVGHTN